MHLVSYIIAGVLIAVILYIIVRKFPTLASIDIQALPSHKESQLKKTILANRLSRKFSTLWSQIYMVLVPTLNVIRGAVLQGYKKTRELEKQYRLRRKQGRFPDSPNPAELDILHEAREQFEEGNLAGAEEAYIAIIRHNPKHIEAYEGLIDVYLAGKDYEHAQETLSYLLKFKEQTFKKKEGIPKQKANNTLPIGEKQELAVHHYELGQVYERNDEKERALRSYKDAVKLDGNNPKYLNSLLEMSILLGNKLLADKTFEKLKRVNPQNSKLSELKKRVEMV